MGKIYFNDVEYSSWGGYRKPRLPLSYQEVEWLESTGNQYIETGMACNKDFTLDIDFSISKTISGENPIASIWQSLYNYWNLFVRTGSSSAVTVYTAGHHTISHRNFFNPTHIHIERTGSAFHMAVDDQELDWTYSYTYGSATTLKLFARGDWVSSNGVRIWNAKVTANGVTKEFVPCYRKSDSKIGMYEVNAGTFYENRGTVDFLKGENIGGVTMGLMMLNGINYAGGVDDSHDYSTTEKVVGTWIDGSDVYERTIYIPSISISGSESLTVESNFNSFLIAATGVYISPDNVTLYMIPEGRIRVFVNASHELKLEAINSGSFNGGKGYLTLLYVKNT